MTIDRVQDGTRLTISLSGRLETSTAPELQEVVDNQLKGVTDVCIDMGGVEYVSSAGLRVLLSATKKMRAGGGSMRVRNINPTVMEVLTITGFNKILTIG